MGSYISILNNTGDTIMVKIGDDQEALRIAGIVGTVVGGVATAITGAGFIVGALSGGLVTITASTALVTATRVVDATAIALNITGYIRNQFTAQGYKALQPNESYKSDKMTLSLWRQCHVVRARRSGTKVYLEETYMRPIFSGATDGSVAVHDVAFWVNKYPYKSLKIFDVQLTQQLDTETIDRNRTDVLAGGQFLESSKSARITSPNKQYYLCQQIDSNLVLYRGTAAIWSNNMWKKGVVRTIMQDDGNLVSYNATGQALWSSGTYGKPGSYLVLQNDGNLVIYMGKKAVWATNTYGR